MSTKTNGVDVSEWARAPVQRGSAWGRFVRAIYDSEEHTFLGRTATRWGIVLAFYSVFYAVLAVLFAVCMGGLYLSLDSDRPTYTLNHSLIGSNPGVAYRPRPEDSDGLLIKYGVNNKTLIDRYVQQLDDFFLDYARDPWFQSQKECTRAERYGFPNQPCLFIKLNKIFEWVPQYFDGNVRPLPADMPDDLTQYINGLDLAQRSQVWVSCAEEAQSTNVTWSYPWGRGLSHSYFPFTNQPGYRSPILAVKTHPPVNTLVTIRCRFWAGNVIMNKSMKEPSGYTRIQIIINDSGPAPAQ